MISRQHIFHSALILFLISMPVLVMSQMEPLLRNAVQLTTARAFTLHYQQPVALSVCFEGCIPEKQVALMASTNTLSYYRQIRPRHTVRLGFGLVDYRFEETGLASDGSSSYHPYVDIQDYTFFALLMGHRFMVSPQKALSPFIESTLFYEWGDQYDFNENLRGASLQLGLGIAWRMTQTFSLTLDGYYKSAIMNYKRRHSGDPYYPFSYGMQLALLFYLF